MDVTPPVPTLRHPPTVLDPTVHEFVTCDLTSSGRTEGRRPRDLHAVLRPGPSAGIHTGGANASVAVEFVPIIVQRNLYLYFSLTIVTPLLMMIVWAVFLQRLTTYFVI